MYVVVGMHRVQAQHLEEYLENVRRHVENSAAEPGCVRYEALQDSADPAVICLFEVFADEAAFLAHRETEHYRWWMALSAGWRDGGVIDRHVMDFVSATPQRQA